MTIVWVGGGIHGADQRGSLFRWSHQGASRPIRGAGIWGCCCLPVLRCSMFDMTPAIKPVQQHMSLVHFSKQLFRYLTQTLLEFKETQCDKQGITRSAAFQL